MIRVIKKTETHLLVPRVADKLGQYRKILVAFSGGLDSTVLLHLLIQLRHKNPEFQIRAVHVHHGLSASADAWSDHCEKLCSEWGVSMTVKRVTVEGRECGIEAGARKARYFAFNEVLTVGEILTTGQHLDDQSETVLLALKRGSGPVGISAMAASGRLGNNILLRPMIEFSRLQIEDYAHKNELLYVNDESNQDLRFDRNFLRLQVLPILNKRWPNLILSIARTASLCAEQEKLLDELLSDQLHALLSEDNSLSIFGLLRYSRAYKFALLRRWISRHDVAMPSYKQLQELWDSVALSRVDAVPILKLEAYQIQRFRGRLYLLPLMKNLRNICLNWSRVAPLRLPDGLGYLISGKGEIHLRSPTERQQVSIRFSAQGRTRIVGRTHSRSIKKLWQEFGVPPWMRQRIPLIYYDTKLIAALGVFICEEGCVEEGKKEWKLHWSEGENLKLFQ